MVLLTVIVEMVFSIFDDKYFFWVFQLGLIFLTLYAYFNERFNNNSGRNVKRGGQGQYTLYLIFGTLSVIIIQIVSSSKEAENYRTILTLMDSSITVYLCFFNSWSRNKIVGIYNKFTNKVETL